MATYLLYVLLFLYGACIGSFLNVCIYRVPIEGQSIVWPRSFCPSCHTMIPWRFNIPLLSYLLLRGKCHFCKAKISFRYFFVELLTAVCFAGLFWFFLDQDHFYVRYVYAAVFTCALIVITFIDFDHFIIPDVIDLPGVGVGILFCSLFPYLMGKSTHLQGALSSTLGAVFGGGLILTIAVVATWVLKKEAMGMGDVKFMAMIGAFLGIKGVVLSLMIGSFAGSIVGLSLILVKNEKWDTRIPFGPYLAMGAFVAMIAGGQIVEWYLALIGVN